MDIKTDLEIAQSCKLKPISEIAEALGLPPDAWEPYGRDLAKIDPRRVPRKTKNSKLVLVTATSPTPAGEGKTTTTIGLADALRKRGKRSIVCLREPSMGPVFGLKGGATGGGYAQVVPMEKINLHFTGDFHAIAAANNLLAALIDNSLHRGNPLDIDPNRIIWKRCLDMNDRALREVVVGLGGSNNGPERRDGFNITVASEIMAAFCLAEDEADLRRRLDRMVIAYSRDGHPIQASALNATGALMALLHDALKPNLAQTLESSPALIHGGPFANIAHGCNSVRATRLGMMLADYTITEAGFGADLGAEKFLNIKCRQTGLCPDAAVLVTTLRSLKYHGGVALPDLAHQDVAAMLRGLPNLLRHAHTLREHFGIPSVVALNRFVSDSPAELEALRSALNEAGLQLCMSEAWAKGGNGALELADAITQLCENNEKPVFRGTYSDDMSPAEKIQAVARQIYGAKTVEFSPEAERELQSLVDNGYSQLPICMAKTPYSFTDDAHQLGAPENFTLHVREIRLAAGAGFIIALTGQVMTMPGLPRSPAAERIELDENGRIRGMF